MMPQYKERKKTDLIVIHCSATPPDMDIGADVIRRWHIVDNRWLDIGYHYVIKRDGTLEYGREETVIGSHVYGNNYNSIGICLIGGVDENNNPQNNYTTAQLETLRSLTEYLEKKYPEAQVVLHRDLDESKMCPCASLEELYR